MALCSTMPHVKVKGITISDGRQKSARQPGGLRRPLQYEKVREDGRKMWTKDKEESRKTARGVGLYPITA